jgi:D-lyxose ketol-isomerase
VGEGQETPTHSHRIKMEDIIVRGGGTLVVEMQNPTPEGGLADTPVEVMVDGERRRLDPGAPLRLTPGESVTVTRSLWHRFYGEPGRGPVFVGEVSQVNDDLTDNYFFDEVGRFAAIEEDEPALFPLWNELPQAS